MSETGGSARIARPAWLSAALVALAACSAGSSDASTLPSGPDDPPASEAGADVTSGSPAPTVVELDAVPSSDPSVTEPTRRRTPVRASDADDPPDSGVTVSDGDGSASPDGPADEAPTTVPPSTTTTEPPIDAADPECVVRATADTSLESAVRGLMAASTSADAVGGASETVSDSPADTSSDASDDDTLAGAAEPVDVAGLWIENGFADTVSAGDLIDVCVGNGLDDVDGGELQITEAEIEAARSAAIERQQARLNELFADLGTGDIAVDGRSGDRTGQRLCGARLMLGLTPSMADMIPGTAEQATLFATESLPTPFDHDADDERWILIDRTCQLLFAGTGSNMVYAFPTSTGEEGFETRLQDRARAIRFNPAVENGGWHDSSEFPVGVDNPLNGNMYKPLYFDLGQAIHGATHVPPVPDSKGCARLRVGDHDRLIAWVGLAEAQEETWRREDLTIEVSVQGDFIDR